MAYKKLTMTQRQQIASRYNQHFNDSPIPIDNMEIWFRAVVDHLEIVGVKGLEQFLDASQETTSQGAKELLQRQGRQE